MKLKFKKLHPAAVAPQYATPGAACFDLTAIDDGSPHRNDQRAAIYRTGLSFEVPAGHVMLVYSRSGHGFKDAVRLSNCVGVIDSDYRGEVMVSLRFDASNESGSSFNASVGGAISGDRIAQAMIVPIPAVTLVEVSDLSDTVRGSGGFGSTGA